MVILFRFSSLHVSLQALPQMAIKILRRCKFGDVEDVQRDQIVLPQIDLLFVEDAHYALLYSVDVGTGMGALGMITIKGHIDKRRVHSQGLLLRRWIRSKWNRGPAN
jgi:hypothetical protein